MIPRRVPVFLRLCRPESENEVYGDTVTIYEQRGDVWETLWVGKCRTSPNPHQPRTGKSWSLVYALIALGMFKFKSVIHDEFKKCLIVNRGGIVPTINFNARHGANIAKEIFVHKGYSRTWSGSAGCITIDPDHIEKFMSFFPEGYAGMLYITDNIDFTPEREIL